MTPLRDLDGGARLPSSQTPVTCPTAKLHKVLLKQTPGPTAFASSPQAAQTPLHPVNLPTPHTKRPDACSGATRARHVRGKGYLHHIDSPTNAPRQPSDRDCHSDGTERQHPSAEQTAPARRAR